MLAQPHRVHEIENHHHVRAIWLLLWIKLWRTYACCRALRRVDAIVKPLRVSYFGLMPVRP